MVLVIIIILIHVVPDLIHQVVKAGLLLGLFGGRQKFANVHSFCARFLPARFRFRCHHRAIRFRIVPRRVVYIALVDIAR